MRPTLHRAWFRQRANPRASFLNDLGRPRGGCEPGARWSRVAIRADDVALTFEVRNSTQLDGTQFVAVYVDGILRSEAELSALRPWGMAEREGCTRTCMLGTFHTHRVYTICKVNEWRHRVHLIACQLPPSLHANYLPRCMPIPSLVACR